MSGYWFYNCTGRWPYIERIDYTFECTQYPYGGLGAKVLSKALLFLLYFHFKEKLNDWYHDLSAASNPNPAELSVTPH